MKLQLYRKLENLQINEYMILKVIDKVQLLITIYTNSHQPSVKKVNAVLWPIAKDTVLARDSEGERWVFVGSASAHCGRQNIALSENLIS